MRSPPAQPRQHSPAGVLYAPRLRLPSKLRFSQRLPDQSRTPTIPCLPGVWQYRSSRCRRHQQNVTRTGPCSMCIPIGLFALPAVYDCLGQGYYIVCRGCPILCAHTPCSPIEIRVQDQPARSAIRSAITWTASNLPSSPCWLPPFGPAAQDCPAQFEKMQLPQRISIDIPVQYNPYRPRLLQHPGILLLMVLGCMGERNEDSRQAPHCDLSDGKSPLLYPPPISSGYGRRHVRRCRGTTPNTPILDCGRQSLFPLPDVPIHPGR